MTVSNNHISREHHRYLLRAFWIDHQVRNHRYPNARTIAEHFEITAKTAQRTLDYLRDQMRMPLGYSAAHRGWYYTEPCFALPAVELTEGDLVAILLAEKLSRQYRGTAIGRQVETAFAKVLDAMTDTITIDLNALAEAHSFEAAATAELDPALFTQLGRAVLARREVEMEYFTASSGEVKWRRVKPLHLRNFLGDWYLIAWDYLRDKPLDFHCGRIRKLRVTEEPFAWPEGFDLQGYLNSGFGMIRGCEPVEVEIVFDEYQSRWMRERLPFHPTETRAELPGGELQVSIRVTALDGVKRFVMQYGAHARVVRPEELRQAIRSELEAMTQLYAASKEETP